MKLEQILSCPESSLLYMERMVNDGSPSKFSFTYTTSKETCPIYVEKFSLCCVKSDETDFVTFGKCNYDFFNDDLVLLHPDWKKEKTQFSTIDTNIQVIPTSSSRTVKILDQDIYIKLSYPGVLGRITRELRTEHILSSIDITNAFFKLIEANLVPNTFAFFPEYCGKLFKQENGDIGYVIRDGKPVGRQCKRIRALIPAFSLFSSDRQFSDVPLIIQILYHKKNKIDYLLEQLIYPIIDCYFSCVFNGGIQPEMHSQNFLIGIDTDLNVVSIVLRDLESADKDLVIMNRLGFPFEMKSYPYKFIDEKQNNYLIKHSFMYDHKLGEYFFDELLKCVQKYEVAQIDTMQSLIKAYVKKQYGFLLEYFFPENGKWYKFENILIDRTQNSRPYISFSNPKYR
ncbi:hypothetical protein ACQRBH_14135 [Bariatricus sp. SGI.161]|uniref:hypothetical protein n=1 Tax=Bariatricus sp. SGI.161 TaxID=3420550 RepID=UPI003D031DED